MYKIAVINPIAQSDYLGNTVLDGLMELSEEGKVELRTTGNYPTPFSIDQFVLDDKSFVNYAQTADLVILIWAKKATNYKMAENVAQWQKTVFVDGSEFGKNNRYDFDVQRKVLEGTYKEIGAIDKEMLSKCRLYFRREKPYINGIIPLPFGIERRYRNFFEQNKDIKKDIDFVCIFGQDEYPIMRRYAREMLVDFCKKHNFTYAVEKTKGFNFDDKTKQAGRNEFYELLARAKVGISIGGGGFDTARFWEILGNGCMLLTEKIDIFESTDQELGYDRIIEFNNLFDFEKRLQGVAHCLRTMYDDPKMKEQAAAEYEKIVERHGSKARVMTILSKSKEAGILN